MNKIFFSVVIPLYNKEAYITQTILSVLEQTYTNYEIIVVDDGSTDNGYNVVKSLAHPKIKLIHQENAGPSAARNRGINESSGDYIAFLDADDKWLAEKLEQHYNLHTQHPDLYWSCSNYYILKDNSYSTPEYLGRESIVDDAIDGIIKKLPLSSISIVVRKEAFIEKKLQFNEQYRRSEDREMWYSLACHFPKIGYLTECLAIYNRVDDSLTKRSASDEDLSFVSMLARLRVELEMIEKRRREKLIAYINRLNRGRLLSIWRNSQRFTREYNVCKPYMSTFYLLKLKYLVTLPLIVKRVILKLKLI